jgi:hypothetical protein
LVSGFTHLWNPVGYPDVFFDEGIYMRRAMNFLDTGNPQEDYLYDHPYFGQITIASILKITHYHDYHPSSESESLQSLYLYPRIFMGLLAIIDTLLIYKIVQIKYGKNPAFIASMLFAVVPFTWILKRILLDSILLPLVLGSIFLALYFTKAKQNTRWIIFSGILLGLAVFTKIPAFTMVFVVAWIVYTKRKKFSDILLLLIPFILIPLLWPANAIYLDQFDLWQKDILWQSQRTNDIWGILKSFFVIDPLIFIIGFSGIFFAALRRDKFLLLWFIPFVIFLSSFGYKQYFHWIMMMPVFCIAGSLLLDSISVFKITKKNLYPVIIAMILIFGFVSTTLLIINNISINQFDALSYVLKNYDDDVTVLASPVYSWILYDFFDRENVPKDYSSILFYPINTEKTVIIEDAHYRIDLKRGSQLQETLDKSRIIKTFQGTVSNFDSNFYPYTSIQDNFEASEIRIREGIGMP